MTYGEIITKNKNKLEFYLQTKTTVNMEIDDYKEKCTQFQISLLIPQHTNPPQFYGLSKIKQIGIPERPIMSSLGSAHFFERPYFSTIHSN